MEEKKFCVYKHTSPSGKVYIGITCRSLNKRWRNGKGYETSSYFVKAIEKYGWENITHEILASGLSESEASTAEQFYISLYNSTDENFGYNLKEGGYSGGRYTDKVKKRISESNRQFWDSHPEMRKEFSDRMIGKKKSDEARKNMSISKTGTHPFRSETHNKNISIRLKAFYETNEEARKRQSDRIVGYSLAKRQFVIQLLDDGSFVGMYESARAAERATGIGNRNIIRCCHGGAKHAGGYRWQFAIDYNSGREIAQ